MELRLNEGIRGRLRSGRIHNLINSGRDQRPFTLHNVMTW
jgi:hypothetical protein